MVLEATCGAEIENLHLASLADTMEASDALLDLHRVPGKVEVDHHMAKLQIKALAPIPVERRTGQPSRNRSITPCF